jgi:Rrf2 family transcriptional regulator, nitric oxide-sensitive transcriptional repressor
VRALFFVKRKLTCREVDIVKLTIYTDYSLRVLLYLASKPEATATITEITDYYNISRNHLVKVVHNLGIHEFITTTRGKNGGIKLARPAEEILLSDVVRKTEPDMDLLECFNPKTDNCVISPTCRLKSMLYEGRSAFMAVLEKNTLADAARPVAQSKSGESVYVNISQLKR